MKEKKLGLKDLVPYMGKRKILLVFSMLFSAISGVLALVPFVYLWLIIKEVVVANGDFSLCVNIVKNGWMCFMFALLAMLIYFASLMCSHFVAFRVSANMKKDMLEHVSKISLGDIEKFGSGKLRKIINESSNATETLLAHNLPDSIQAVVTPLVMIILLFVFDYRLGLVSLIPTVLGFLCMMKMTGKQMELDMKEYQDALEDMNNEAVEYVRGMPVVKTFNQSVFSFKRFKASIDNYSKFCISYTKKARMPMVMFQTCLNLTFAFLIAITLIIVGQGVASDKFILNIMFYILFTPVMTTTLMKMIFGSENKIVVNDALERVNKIKSIPPMTYGKITNFTNNEIEFRHVNFKYDDSVEENIINDLSFVVKSNSSLALVGASGSGKTTIANLIARFYDISSGAILIGNRNIKDYQKSALMEEISYVFQDNKLLKTSILENVKMANKSASEEEVKEALHLAMCDDIIAKFKDGFNTIIGSKGIYLSGGETQRICIARAMIKKSHIVILDEATAFADPENEYLVQQAFENLKKNKTVIIIAHRLTTIKNMDSIIVLDKGTIKESGTHEELMNLNGLYKKMYEDYKEATAWKVGK